MKLKPCPFCGGDAELYSTTSFAGGLSPYVWYIVCTKCGIETAGDISDHDAVIAWNTRTKDGEQE